MFWNCPAFHTCWRDDNMLPSEKSVVSCRSVWSFSWCSRMTMGSCSSVLVYSFLWECLRRAFPLLILVFAWHVMHQRWRVSSLSEHLRFNLFLRLSSRQLFIEYRISNMIHRSQISYSRLSIQFSLCFLSTERWIVLVMGTFNSLTIALLQNFLFYFVDVCSLRQRCPLMKFSNFIFEASIIIS